jgi:signal peptidase
LSDLSADPWAARQPVAGEDVREELSGGETVESAGEEAEAVDAERAVEAAGAEPRAARLPARDGLWGWVGGVGKRPHAARESLRFSLVVLAAVALAYWFTQWPLPDLTSSHPGYNFYLIQPAIWTGLALLAGYGWLRLAERPRFSRLLVGIAFLVGVFHVAVLVIAGVLWTFGDSPIAGKLINYPKNLLYITTLLAGAEAARAYLFHVWRQRSGRLAFAAVAILFFAVAMPAGQWTPFGTLQRSFDLVGGRWLPAIALSALCTWLVSYGGIGPSFGYRFALVAFEWFSPILPNLDWPVLLVIGVAVPFAATWLVRGIYADTAEGKQRKPAVEKQEVESKRGWWFWTSWVLTLAIVAAGVLFFMGFMGFKMVIVDGMSMEPAYSRGDVAIVREDVDPVSLAEDDVIVYLRGSLPVVHRIISIEEGADGRVFTTQGDNMDAPDPPVTEDQVQGKVVFLVPGVGYLNLWLRGR